MHRPSAPSQEREQDDEGDRKDNSRGWKMSEKFAYWQKKFYSECAEILEQHQPFYIFRNEGLGCQTVRSYVEPYVEEWRGNNIYAQWKLQMDQHPAASRIKLYNERKHRIIGPIRYPRN